jgi:hypothetical protein
MRYDTEYRIRRLVALLARTDQTSNSGCWTWQGAKDSAGYGRTSYAGKSGITAHRAVWLASGYGVPEELELDHECGNRACVRPGEHHVRLLSHPENMREAKYRRSQGFRAFLCKRGHQKDIATGVCRPCRYEAIKAFRARNLAKVREWDRLGHQRRRAAKKAPQT